MSNEKPKSLTDKHLEYLDRLRESGSINMFGARPYLEESFPDLSNTESMHILGYWMNTYGERHKKK